MGLLRLFDNIGIIHVFCYSLIHIYLHKFDSYLMTYFVPFGRQMAPLSKREESEAADSAVLGRFTIRFLKITFVKLGIFFS